VIGLMPVADALAMWSPDADYLGCGSTVEDVVAVKRRSPTYPALLAAVRRDGITVPVHVQTDDLRWELLDGHHRIVAAIDAGLTTVPYTTVPLTIDR